MTIRNALLGCRSAAWATALGVSTGLAIWDLAHVGGPVALLIASPKPLFLPSNMPARPISYGSACNRLRSRASVPARSAVDRGAGGPAELRPRQAYMQGVVSDLSNPKTPVLLLMLPQFRTLHARGLREPGCTRPVVQPHDPLVADGYALATARMRTHCAARVSAARSTASRA